MAARKPKIVYEWVWHGYTDRGEYKINWKLMGANGEIVCESRQGARDKTDAIRSVTTAAGLFNGDVDAINHVGPGKKPEVQ